RQWKSDHFPCVIRSWQASKREIFPTLVISKTPTSTKGISNMRNSLMRSVIGLLVVLAFASVAIAQRGKLPGKDSLYNGNRLKPDPTPGGPAPVRDISGSWAGNLTPDRGAIPPLTPLGQKLFALNKPET